MRNADIVNQDDLCMSHSSNGYPLRTLFRMFIITWLNILGANRKGIGIDLNSMSPGLCGPATGFAKVHRHFLISALHASATNKQDKQCNTTIQTATKSSVVVDHRNDNLAGENTVLPPSPCVGSPFCCLVLPLSRQTSAAELVR